MSFLDKRFGTAAVEKGIISLKQLQKGLELQVKENVEGKPHRMIGTILQDLGYMKDDQVANVLRSMANE